jgi:hypothetical protein
MSKLVIGIDIGARGGIAAISEDSIEYTLLGSVGLWSKFIKKFKKKPDLVVIEDLHSIFGASAKSNFQFGVNNGIIIGALEAMDYPYLKVAPKKWQKTIWKEQDHIYYGTKLDTKATSLNAALRLYPLEKFLMTSRSSVPHDGLVDAVLLATYGYDCCL